MTLPKKVIAEDRRLDATAVSAQEQLAELRWHWTLDESNPDRVSFRAYAEAVGLNNTAIRAMANGYATWSADASVSTRTLTDCIELAKLSTTKQAATEATAQAMGLSVTAVASGHRDKVKETVASATEAAERKGTSVEEEIPRIAQAHETQRKSAAKQRAEHKQNHSLRYIQIEGHLAAAKDRLGKALDVAHDVELADEEVELIVDMLRQVNVALRMLDARFVGESGADWDAEAEKLLGGAR